jgi:hypothetical protein
MSNDMTLQQALAEAVKRWGKNAGVRRAPPLKPAQIERIKRNIREEETKKEERALPDAERCEYTSDKGHRCTQRRGHEKPRAIYNVAGTGFRMVAQSPSHSPRASLEQRIAMWEALEITMKLRGWCTIGRTELGGLFFMVKAEAPTFRGAFAKVDAEEAADKAKYDKIRETHNKRTAALQKARAAKAAKRAARAVQP